MYNDTWVQLVAVTDSEPKEDFLALGARRAMVDCAQRMWFLMDFRIIRHVEEVCPSNAVCSILGKVMPEAWKSMQPYIKPYNPPESSDLTDVCWEADYFLKGQLWNHWHDGCNDKPELTVSMAKDCFVEQDSIPIVFKDYEGSTSRIAAFLDT